MVRHNSKLFREGTLTDVELIVRGRTIRAHRMILSRSSVFLAMFQHNMREGATGKVIVNSFEYRIMNELITFMYTNKVNDLEEKAGDLLIAADYFDLTDLKEVCRTWLEANITLENFALSLQIADRYGIKSLKDSVLRFIIL